MRGRRGVRALHQESGVEEMALDTGMAERVVQVLGETDGRSAGMRARGEYRCQQCGYSLVAYRALPVCPMCQHAEWERLPWKRYPTRLRLAEHQPTSIPSDATRRIDDHSRGVRRVGLARWSRWVQ